MDKEEEAVILQLQNAKKEIEDTGKVSQKLKQRIFALMLKFEALWLELDKAGQEQIEKRDASKMFPKLSPQMRSRIIAWSTVTNGIAFLEQLGTRRRTKVTEAAIGQHAIPNREALDRLLRYETTFDRSLTRALDRLDRLQRRRSGDWICPGTQNRNQ